MAVGVGGFARQPVACDAVARDVAQMGPCRLQATLANLDDPRLDDGAPNPEGRVAVARGEDAPDAGAAPDTIAMEGGAAGLRSAAHLAPGQPPGTEHLAQVAAAALATPRADSAKPGL